MHPTISRVENHSLFTRKTTLANYYGSFENYAATTETDIQTELGHCEIIPVNQKERILRGKGPTDHPCFAANTFHRNTALAALYPWRK